MRHVVLMAAAVLLSFVAAGSSRRKQPHSLIAVEGVDGKWSPPMVDKAFWKEAKMNEYADQRAHVMDLLLQECPRCSKKLRALMRRSPFAQTAALYRLYLRGMVYDTKSAAMNALQKHLFFWLPNEQNINDVLNIQSRYPRGIVMVAGNRHFRLALLGIRVIRELHKCDYPIEFFHNGPNDLSSERKQMLATIPNVHVRDVSMLVDAEALHLEGYAIKTFSFVFSWAREALIVDADALIFQHPDTFFNYQPYRDTGALLFRDRRIKGSESLGPWLDSILLDVTPRVRAYAIYRGESAHQVESSVMAFDMARIRPALIMAALYNTPAHITELTEWTLGEKEGYFIALEQLGAPYAWGPRMPCMGGPPTGLVESPSGASYGGICSHIMHFDEAGNPWFNDGSIVHDKLDPRSPLLDLAFTCDARDGTLVKPDLCFVGRLTPVSSDVRQFYSRVVSLYDPRV